MSAAAWRLDCVTCGSSHPGLEVRYRCACGGTLDVVHDLDALRGTIGLDLFDRRLASKERADRSGVWRFRELVLPLTPNEIVSKPEGNTNLYRSAPLASWVGIDDLAWKHEGENPTGSFKDRGMTVGISVAKKLDVERVACASTGNTSASMASYAAMAGMKAYVFIPAGKVAFGKLSQALAYGATTIRSKFTNPP
jgi:threonine synthase